MIRIQQFDRDPAIDKAIAEYQVTLRKFLAGEITSEERNKYHQAVFDACNKSTNKQIGYRN